MASRARTLMLLAALGALSACGPKTMKQRLIQSESIANEVDDLLSKAEAQLQALEPDDAAKLIEKARAALLKPNADLYPEWQMLADRLKRDDGTLESVRELRKKRDLEAKAKAQEDDVKPLVASFQKAMEALSDPKSGGDELDEYEKRLKKVQEGLAEQPELEKEVPTWAAQLKGWRALVSQAETKLPAIRLRIDFAQGPVAAEASASSALKAVALLKKPADRAEKQLEVVDGYRNCVSKGKSVLAKHSGATLNPIAIGGRTVIPSSFVNDCERALTTAKASLRKLQKAAAAKK